ncbi:MAG: ester cyclase [Thermomicrobiales bacterium]
MTCTSNKTVVVRFIRDVLNKGGHRAPSELVAADHALHSLQGDLYGPEGLRIAVTEYRTGFPDLVVDVEEIMADGDWVARRFTLRGTHTGRFRGMPGSGRCIAAQGIGIDRFANGRLAESWVSLDAVGMMRQMGWVGRW